MFAYPTGCPVSQDFDVLDLDPDKGSGPGVVVQDSLWVTGRSFNVNVLWPPNTRTKEDSLNEQRGPRIILLHFLIVAFACRLVEGFDDCWRSHFTGCGTGRQSQQDHEQGHLPSYRPRQKLQSRHVESRPSWPNLHRRSPLSSLFDFYSRIDLATRHCLATNAVDEGQAKEALNGILFVCTGHMCQDYNA